MLNAYQRWDLHARAAITLEGQGYNIGIRWQREPDRATMLLEAPFGQGVFRIQTDAGESYRLQLPDGQVFRNRTPEALLEDVIGWSLPISGLEYWVRGLPRPDSVYTQRLDGAGRSRTIDQDRWSIAYLDYFDRAADAGLPRRIDLSTDDVRLKLVIERWQPAATDDNPSSLFPEFD